MLKIFLFLRTSFHFKNKEIYLLFKKFQKIFMKQRTQSQFLATKNLQVYLNQIILKISEFRKKTYIDEDSPLKFTVCQKIKY